MTDIQPPPPTSSDQAVIEVKTSFFFLAFILHFCKVYVALDGQAVQQKWGTVRIPVVPGRHQVEAWTNYFIAPQMGRNGVVIDTPPGTVTRVHWKAPWLIFLKGSIAVTDVAPLTAGDVSAAPTAALPTAPIAPPSAAPAGWHADPSGRHEQRYFDGTAWTEHVSTAGVAGTDPTET